jgi:hypothetical protein
LHPFSSSSLFLFLLLPLLLLPFTLLAHVT